MEIKMKLLPMLIAAVFSVSTFTAVAAPAGTDADAPKKLTAQQLKMKSCNKDAKEKTLKGADRKAFMKSCLKKDTASAGAKAVVASSKPH